jgi:hypothetical protein
LRTLKSKFDTGITPVVIEPIVAPGSLTIKQWALKVNNHPLITGEGANEVLDEVTRIILSKDVDELRTFKTKVEGAIAS